ncbi:PIG-L deacetylase family protein [Meiothermus granaticius]|uniref:Putative N-acetyl-alpha-D-glucosaminyl L-malate deacetylase 2 n=1 Tax=Meiothermus granaticius NBRC 107808 TaxID=1227551 RepID=A0A399F8Y1_9DEIN|nr:PIG-L family deacetylase [Meiothermus granaticius]RIH92126.1 putative N-acetyl-alpha-D-glucosaminyl L-malate deacetylase 2 [Meiothermus granaticius NBRC 107808]GEM86259.1 PIG-L domain-containing protein [Meiothermus granaticius NBRC 107808]
MRARRIKKRYLLLVLLATAFLVINAPGLFSLGYRLYYGSRVQSLPQALRFGPADRLLVLSPHPDDEALCCAGAMQQALKAGAQVYVVWFTNGDGFEWDAMLLGHTPRPGPQALRQLAATRQAEARAAARILGVPEAHLFFLGYPDQGLARLLREYRSRPYISRYTALSWVPYGGNLTPGSLYTGENLERDFKRVLDRVQPTQVLAPSPQDAHPDHRAVAELALQVLAARGESERLRYWIVHGGLEWPLPKGLHPTLPLEPPPRGRGLEWTSLPLSQDEATKKLQAIQAHHTQMRLLGRFMRAFVRQNELFSTTPLPQH